MRFRREGFSANFQPAGELLIEKELEKHQYYGVGYPLLSPDGRQLAFSFEESLWILNLDNAALKQFKDLGQYSCPYLWVDSTTLMIGRSLDEHGATELSIIDLETGSRRSLETSDLRVIGIYDQRRLIGESHSERKIYLLDPESGQRELLLDGYYLGQVWWKDADRALLSQGKDIFMWSKEGGATPLVKSERMLGILGIHDGYLHYLQSNKRGTHWSWKKQKFAPDW